tara:strand:- start:2530 stop:2805 length:276 start_codon:yes stop_codon:yes gene_type:complete
MSDTVNDVAERYACILKQRDEELTKLKKKLINLHLEHRVLEKEHCDLAMSRANSRNRMIVLGYVVTAFIQMHPDAQGAFQYIKQKVAGEAL